MDQSTLYLDYNATSPLRADAKAAMDACGLLPYNASSQHGFGRRAKHLLEEARASVARLLRLPARGPGSRYVLFVGSGTEANNLFLRGCTTGKKIITSSIEHPSVLTTSKSIDPNCIILPVTADGVVDLAALQRVLGSLTSDPVVSVMLANNESGVIQPVAELAKIVRAAWPNAIIHTDAVQAVGRIDVDMEALGVDALTLSSHKMGGPLGAAALVIRKDLVITPSTTGGGQEQRLRAGTENVPAIVGFGTVAHAPSDVSHLAALRDRLESALSDTATVYGQHATRLPQTSLLGMPDVKNETQLIHFDLHHLAVSAGSACSSGKVDASPVLLAMGIDAEEAATAIRVSLGPDTTAAEVDAFIAAWQQLYHTTQDAA